VLAAAVGSLLFVSCDYSTDGGTTEKPAVPRGKPVDATLEQIMSGQFKSAVDKEGHGGVLVKVRNLAVVSVAPARMATGTLSSPTDHSPGSSPRSSRVTRLAVSRSRRLAPTSRRPESPISIRTRTSPSTHIPNGRSTR